MKVQVEIKYIKGTGKPHSAKSDMVEVGPIAALMGFLREHMIPGHRITEIHIKTDAYEGQGN